MRRFGFLLLPALLVVAVGCGGSSAPTTSGGATVSPGSGSAVNLVFTGALAGTMSNLYNRASPPAGVAGTSAKMVFCGVQPKDSTQFAGRWAARFSAPVGSAKAVNVAVAPKGKYKGAGEYSDISLSRITVGAGTVYTGKSGTLHVDSGEGSATLDGDFVSGTATVHVKGDIHC